MDMNTKYRVECEDWESVTYDTKEEAESRLTEVVTGNYCSNSHSVVEVIDEYEHDRSKIIEADEDD